MKCTVDANYSLVVDMTGMVPVQLIPYSAVSHLRMHAMDFLRLACDAFVSQLAAAFRAVIRRTLDAQKAAEFPNGE